jgi:hypothetical protein
VNWKDLGIVWSPDGNARNAVSHAMGPTPVLISQDVIRVYLTSLDSNGIGRPIYVEVSSKDPKKVVCVNQTPLLDVGISGSFDDNGIMVTSIVQLDSKTIFMYYAGFEICNKIRYRILTGLAVSNDAGITFKRHSDVPVLERSANELFFRGGPYVMHQQGLFRMWYVAGSSWMELSNKQMPVYVLKYMESEDGISWPDEGIPVMEFSEKDEHGFGRPWVLNSHGSDYEMFYSIRRKSLNAYRLGYATSNNGIDWIRNDSKMNLNVKPGTHASKAIMYSAVISVGSKTYCFYNGDDFGKQGFAVAELLS